jgi:hypothetical protein
LPLSQSCFDLNEALDLRATATKRRLNDFCSRALASALDWLYGDSLSVPIFPPRLTA